MYNNQSAIIPMRNYTYAVKAYNVFQQNGISCEVRHMTLPKFGCVYGVSVALSYDSATQMLRNYNLPYLE